MVLGAAPRFLPRWSAAGRTMLLKEYRICMPLTVDEVSAAPGLASPAPHLPLPRPPAPGRRVPRGRLPAVESAAGGKETWWNITSQTGRLQGREDGALLFPLVTPAGEGGLG